MQKTEARACRRFYGRWKVRTLFGSAASAGATEGEDGEASSISSSGIYFVSPLDYPVGASLQVALQTPHDVTIHAKARIVRRLVTTNGYFAYGAEIDSLGEVDRKWLNDLLLELRREELRADYGKRMPLYRLSDGAGSAPLSSGR